MSITRREFGQILGAAAMSGALPDVSLGTLSDPTTMNGHTPSALAARVPERAHPSGVSVIYRDFFRRRVVTLRFAS